MLALLLLAASVYEAPDPPRPKNRIDDLVFANVQRLGIKSAALCSDAVFLRRAYLELLGTLPTANEARQFLAHPDRSELIDNLLNRDEFAVYWANKWSDVLRVKAEFPINLWPAAAQTYHHWILASFRQNKPYDQFARELLTASGSNFRDPPVNFYRAMQNRSPEGIARTVALTFMGTRDEKVSAKLASFFTRITFKDTQEWKEEIVVAPAVDPRESFAIWLTSPTNPWFARAAANRVWAWMFGRGIVHEPDDLRPDNPSENPELLLYLENEFRNCKYDLKRFCRLIANSTTWQLAPGSGDHFASYPLRRLDAEVLIDALNQITGTQEKYASAIPEPYTVMPDGQRAIDLPDGSITSSFLELFGRPARDTGLDAERVNRITDAQRLHLLNSSHIRRKIEQGPAVQALRRIPGRRERIEAIYLTILSRTPTAEEWRIIGARPSQADLPWALINTVEFLYRH